MADTLQPLDLPARRGVLAYVTTTAVVLLLMMFFGLLMRMTEGKLLPIGPELFYKIMTVHGAGMVGIVSLGSSAIMWYFLRQYVKLSTGILMANLVFFLAGVVMILAAVFVGGYAGAWTFLYPLPEHSMGMWSRNGAALFLGGYLSIGVGFLLFYLDAARGIIGRYGNLGNALGWPQLFGGKGDYGPPPAVVASTMVVIVDSLGLIAAAAILSMMLVNLYVPGFAVNPLLAKNLIYFFGHVFINATIYKAVIGVYEILPRYTDRPWKSNRVFLASWNISTVLVIIIYPHHLLMDYAMPEWMLMMGQIISYLNGLPILVVTAYGALMIVYRSGIRWDMASGLMFLSLFGWTGGVIPAIADGTIVINQVMHNTLWVPGHFHFYLLLGEVSMLFGFMYYLGKVEAGRSDGALDRAGFWVFALAALGFVTMFLFEGKESVPRRYAEHLAAWVPYDRIASAFIALVIAAVLVFVLRFLGRLSVMGSAARHA